MELPAFKSNRAGAASSHITDCLFLEPRLHTRVAPCSEIAQHALTQMQLDNVERVLQPVVVGQGIQASSREVERKTFLAASWAGVSLPFFATGRQW